MKKIYLIIFISILFHAHFFAQCKLFAKNTCQLELLPFIHDGIFNATVITEGESVELFKTFYSGQEYRIAVCNEDKIPQAGFQVMDANRNILFDSKQNNMAKTWDFTLESSQQLIISVLVPTSEKISDKISSGCVAILVGFMNKEDTLDQLK